MKPLLLALLEPAKSLPVQINLIKTIFGNNLSANSHFLSGFFVKS
jgi:hypothetical protein